ncbi:molecular chaperone tir [Lasius niger]|uniref:Molecular chaperone tir n=1 Tax=Lasius niger TaxID=67767 RepID=A0A0J7K1T9_LASNI|nr:molecular chaperone tir [Lasius niger]
MTVQAFLSYAIKDKEGVLALLKHCAPFLKEKQLNIVQDANDVRDVALTSENKRKIEQSDIFIALFTQDYVYNGACRDELYIALQLHLAGKLEILPIAWKECHWTSISGSIQRLVLPKDKRIVTYPEGWKHNPTEPWDQILNRLSLYIQKAECLAQNPERKNAPSPLIQTSQEILQRKPAPRPANEAAENPEFSEKLEMVSQNLSTATITAQKNLIAQASLTIASRSDPVAIKMGNGLPPSLLCYYEGILEENGFAVSMGEFLLTNHGRMEISCLPSCILEVVEGPASLGWGRSKKHRSNLREKLSIEERPSKNGFSPEQVANIFWGFFIAQAKAK